MSVAAFPFAEAVVIVTRTVIGQDGDGNNVYDDDNPTLTATSGAFAPEGSIELVQGQATVISRPTVYLSLGAPTPAASDRVRVRGQLYEIDGEPLVFLNPFTGDQPGAVLRLERVTG
jgi:hypothetical protein